MQKPYGETIPLILAVFACPGLLFSNSLSTVILQRIDRTA